MMLLATDWADRLLRAEIVVPFCLFGLPMIVWGVKSMASASSQARVIEAELQLKRELVAQGRTAEEIERILTTSAHPKLDG